MLLKYIMERFITPELKAPNLIFYTETIYHNRLKKTLFIAFTH